jgi:UDP-N-acetylmuramate dehydrogenase
MVGVPGTVGGALWQNAEANQQEFKSIVLDADLYHLEHRRIEKWSKEKCDLSYRDSGLKNHPYMIATSVRLKLKRDEPSAIEARLEKNLAYRKEKTPFSKPSLGSIFTRLKKGDDWLYPGQLIEASGLKGFRIGGAQVSPVHANYIVNEEEASFDDVMSVIETVERTVLEKQGVQLKREILIWSDR